jgi:hypothetical protein
MGTSCGKLSLVALRRLPEARETTELTIDIRIDLTNAVFMLGDFARVGDHRHEAEVLARSLGDQHRLGQISTYAIMQRVAQGDYDEALRGAVLVAIVEADAAGDLVLGGPELAKPE